MKTNKNFVESLLKDLKKTSRYLSEDYIFNDQESQAVDPIETENPEMASPQVDQPQQQPAVGQDVPGAMQSAEEQAMHAQEVIQHEPIIGKIRETAIEGLKKYSDHPTSSLYEFFKKVFLESDKVLTDTGHKK